MASQELTWSTFLREPATVEPLLRQGDVVLRRRDGESLRLSAQSRDDAEREAVTSALKLLGRAETTKTVSAAELATRLPWTRFLPANDRRIFLDEFLDTLEACLDLGQFVALGRLVAEWKATAALHAEGIAPRLRGPLTKVGGRVRRP